MIAILDYRAGNLTSVERALAYLGYSCRITNDPVLIREAERIIFPGVGAAGKSMADLKELGLDALLRERLQAGVPILGICVGLQVLLEYSEENDTQCLSIISGKVRQFPKGLADGTGSPSQNPAHGLEQCRFHQETSGICRYPR